MDQGNSEGARDEDSASQHPDQQNAIQQLRDVIITPLSTIANANSSMETQLTQIGTRLQAIELGRLMDTVAEIRK